MAKARERSKGMFEPKRKAESLRGPFYGAKEARGSEFRVGRFRFVVRLCEIARGFGWLGGFRSDSEVKT